MIIHALQNLWWISQTCFKLVMNMKSVHMLLWQWQYKQYVPARLNMQVENIMEVSISLNGYTGYDLYKHEKYSNIYIYDFILSETSYFLFTHGSICINHWQLWPGGPLVVNLLPNSLFILTLSAVRHKRLFVTVLCLVTCLCGICDQH